MAAIVVLSAAVALLRSNEGLRDLRSPVIPLPDDHDSSSPHLHRSASSARGRPSSSLAARHPSSSRSRNRPAPLTERSLRASHLAWLIRLRDLSARLRALEDARAKRLESCWAGKATRRHIRAVRKAVDEAEWVEDKLRQAVVWCRQAGIRKAPVKSLLHVGRDGCASPSLSLPRRCPDRLVPVLTLRFAHVLMLCGISDSLSARPKHNAFPPSLLELPFPLPNALEANIYFLTVPRPPPLARHDAWDAERAAQSHEAPPIYDEAPGFGEIVLERGDELDVAVALLEYERASHTQDAEEVSA